jgi:hypothetical protein
MHRHSIRVLAAVLPLALALPALALPSTARAQDASDSAAYRALIETPLGALPLPLDVAVTGERARRVAVHARYGLMSLDNHEYIHNFGVGLDLPVGTESIGLTAGYYWPDCNGSCSGHFMAAANLSENLVRIRAGGGEDRATFNIGVNGEIGFARPSGATLLSGNLAVPLSLVPARRDLRFVPYVAPGVGVGLVDTDSTEAGLLFTFAAGIGVVASHRFTANLGIRRAFLSTGNWLVGVGFTLGGDH